MMMLTHIMVFLCTRAQKDLAKQNKSLKCIPSRSNSCVVSRLINLCKAFFQVATIAKCSQDAFSIDQLSNSFDFNWKSPIFVLFWYQIWPLGRRCCRVAFHRWRCEHCKPSNLDIFSSNYNTQMAFSASGLMTSLGCKPKKVCRPTERSLFTFCKSFSSAWLCSKILLRRKMMIGPNGVIIKPGGQLLRRGTPFYNRKWQMYLFDDHQETLLAL